MSVGTSWLILTGSIGLSMDLIKGTSDRFNFQNTKIQLAAGTAISVIAHFYGKYAATGAFFLHTFMSILSLERPDNFDNDRIICIFLGSVFGGLIGLVVKNLF